ncbi:MAG TPA: flagellar assembly peptidoglycan hydrolase FlgJ [Rhodocyclaceae bacterium]|nr:flagellar assembly peptidoglycan hydrolase FlgJ [Rhodocyclaceae bacterium]
MFRSDLGASSAAPSAAFRAEQERIALPLGQGNAAGSNASGFSSLMQQLQGEIGDYIKRGGGAEETSSGTLNVEAQAWLARQQATGAMPLAGAAEASSTLSATQQSFLDSVAPWAAEAGERLGVSPQILAAQAALESGWGQRPLRQADGRDSHNLFGLKAGSGWQGDVTETMTTEFEGGLALKKNERFRSYADKGEAFRDFTRLISDNPRYQAALNSGSDARAYAQGLVRGGYASDPAYVDKLTRLAAKIQGD